MVSWARRLDVVVFVLSNRADALFLVPVVQSAVAAAHGHEGWSLTSRNVSMSFSLVLLGWSAALLWSCALEYLRMSRKESKESSRRGSDHVL